MSMSVGPSDGGEPEVMMDINTTPLIDVMLVLLVMLIITIPIQTHAVKLNMPSGAAQQPLVQPEIVQIGVDFDGTVYWNGNIVDDPAVLSEKLAAVASVPDQPEVHLRPHKLVKYDSVMKVMAMAQRLGVTKIGIVGNEQYME